MIIEIDGTTVSYDYMSQNRLQKKIQKRQSLYYPTNAHNVKHVELLKTY
jgi:hypothetical protein